METTEQESIVQSVQSVQHISITIQWMSGDITTILHDSRSSLYWLKREILSKTLNTVTPHLLSLYTKDSEGEWKEYTQSIIKEDAHFYAVIRDPILHERLDYIYSMENNDLWRFTYQEQSESTSRKQISMVVEKGERFCRINEYREAKQQKHPIPWIHTVEGFLEWYLTTEQGMALGEQTLLHLVYLWNNRR